MKPGRPFLSFLWLLADRGLKTGGGALIGIVLARYLGPEDFGRFAVAMGLAAFGKDVVGLGMDRIIQRDLGARADVAGTVVGTYMVMCLCTATFVAFLLSGIAVGTVTDDTTRHMALLLAWISLPQCLCGAYLWFVSQSNARPLVVSLNISYFAFLGLRFILAFSHVSVVYFAWVALADAVVMYALVWILFVKHHPEGSQLKFSKTLCATYFREGWPLLVSVFVGVGADRLQLLMVQGVSSSEVAGHFGAALRMTDPWIQVTSVAAMAFMPKMIDAQAQNYLGTIYRRYLDASMGLTVGMALLVTACAPWAVPLVLGHKYANSVGPMILLFWNAPAVFVSYSRLQYLTLERRLPIEIYHCCVMTAIVFAGTWYLTPVWGAMGAAVALLAGTWLSTWLLPWFIPSARDVARHHLYALTFFVRWRQLIDTAKLVLGDRFKKSKPVS